MKKLMAEEKTVTFHPDSEGYGVIRCSWEKETRKTRITEAAARKVAEGFKAEFKLEAAW